MHRAPNSLITKYAKRSLRFSSATAGAAAKGLSSAGAAAKGLSSAGAAEPPPNAAQQSDVVQNRWA
jgi:hypothetical protein